MKTLIKYFKAGSTRLSIALALVAFLVYSPSLGHGYVLDDAIVLSENSFTQEGWSGISDIWTHDTFSGFFGVEGKSALVEGGRYRPMSLTLFAIEGSLFGFNPFIGHLFNLLWYSALAGLLYAFLYSFLRKHKNRNALALSVTLLFILHPVHSEVVANIKGRDEIIAMFGALAALHILLKNQKVKSQVVAFILMMGALFSKEHVAVFVVLIPMSLYIARKSQWWLSVAAPLFALIVYLIARYQVLGGFLSNQPTELMNNPFMVWSGNTYDALSLWERWPTVFNILPEYIRLLIWPFPLTHDYYPKFFEIANGWNLMAILSFILFTAMTIWAVISLGIRSKWSWGWLWFVISLFPMSNLFINVGTFCSERFLFLASLGGIFLITQLIFRFLPRQLTTGFLVIASTAFLLILETRIPAWSSNFSLFTTDVQTSSESAKANNSAGGVYNDRAGASASKEEQARWAKMAKPHLEKAIGIHPRYKNAYLQLGNSYFYLEDYEQAIRNYEISLDLDPNYTDAQKNLFLAYRQGGKFMGEQRNDLTKALAYLQQAYRLRPDDYETIRLLGVAHGMSKNFEKAVSYFKKGLKKQPNDAQAYYNLGASYMQIGKVDSGQLYLDQARSMDPSIFR